MKKTKRKAKIKMVEVARSFSFKKNLGNYEMADFFCSAKKEVKESEAEATSEALYQFARAEVIKSINLFMAEGKEPKPEPKKEVPSRTRAERADMFQETREGAMRGVADEEN